MKHKTSYQLDMQYAIVPMTPGDSGWLTSKCIHTKPVRAKREYLKEAGQHEFIVDTELLPDGLGATYHLNDGGAAEIRQQFAACISEKVPRVTVVVGRVRNLQCLF